MLGCSLVCRWSETQMRLVFALAAIVFCSSPVKAEELIGSAFTSVGGDGGVIEPDGFHIGFTACPGGLGTNQICNTIAGYDPPFALTSLGLIQKSPVIQTFSRTTADDANLAAVFANMQSTPFNRSLAYCFGQVGSSFSPPCNGGGQSSEFTPGYWAGATITRMEVVVHAFDFVQREIGGTTVYVMRNLDGDQFPVGSMYISLNLHFYGIRGTYQDGLGTPLPEPATWALSLIGIASVGHVLRRQRRLPA